MTRLTAATITDDQLDALTTEVQQLRAHRRLLTAAITRVRLAIADHRAGTLTKSQAYAAIADSIDQLPAADDLAMARSGMEHYRRERDDAVERAAAYRAQVDELTRKLGEYADRGIANGERAEQAEAERDRLRNQARDAATIIRDYDAARQAAEGRVREAQAALDRVRALADRWSSAAKERPEAVIVVGVASDVLRAALDGTEAAPAPAATETPSARLAEASVSACITQNVAPAERCGHLSPETGLAVPPRTECVLRPGHSGSHADDRGCRWWITSESA